MSSDCTRLGQKLSTEAPSSDQRRQCMMVVNHGSVEKTFSHRDESFFKSCTRLSLFDFSLPPFADIFPVSCTDGVTVQLCGSDANPVCLTDAVPYIYLFEIIYSNLFFLLWYLSKGKGSCRFTFIMLLWATCGEQ